MSTSPSDSSCSLAPLPPSRTYRILLVSNENAMIETITGLIRAEGHEVLIAPNGEAALEHIQREPFDLVLTKFGLPGMSGEELAAWIRALLPRQRIVLTVNAREEHRPSGNRSAADVVLHKPFTYEEARVAIYALLGDAGPR